MGESIVVGTDGSETAQRAVAEATRIAVALDAELHVVTACKPMRGSFATAPPEASAMILAGLPDAEAQPIVEQAANAARQLGAKVKTHVHRSDPCDALIDVASRVGAQTIVVGSRGMSGARRLLGSVPDRVSHTAPCNVLIVSTRERRPA